ncbi:MAG TPA: hypothetical protein VFT04_03800 [Gemmatimonadales bacterium]|nr:hypothetical protein [Gemmatimonadales bacterium]
MSHLLRLAGLLFLMATALTLAAAFLAAVYAIGRRNPRLRRTAVLVAVAAVAVHAVLVAAGPLLAPERILAQGNELSFCNFDCHLHLAAHRGRSPDAVVLRFRSDARAVAEHPGRLRVRGYDASGAEHEPLDAIPGTPLAAGDTVEHRIRFAPGVRIERVAASWRDWDRYLVPGPANPLVQQRLSLRLDAPAVDEPVAIERGAPR